MKLVINKCYGGFGLSHKAMMEYAKLAGIKLYAFTQDIGKGLKSPLIPYDGKSDAFLVYYSTEPLGKVRQNEISNRAYFSAHNIERNDPNLIKVVEKLGDKANGQHAKLVIIEIPDGVDYEINEYDGIESIHEQHRSWG